MKEKYLSCFLLAYTLLTCHRSFAYDFEVDGIYYTVTSFEDFIVRVDGLSPAISGIVNIPSVITYSNKEFTVTAIGSVKSNQIETVLIPPTITKIGGFAGSSITSIDIPENVIELGAGAFANCMNLKNVRIPKNISTLQSSMFYGCTNLTQVDWHPFCAGKILEEVFYDCSSLKTIRIPATVSEIGGPGYILYGTERITAFKNCASLDSLIIEDGKGTMTVRDNYEGSFDSHCEFYGSKIGFVYMGRPIELHERASYEPFLRYVEHLVIGDSVEAVSMWLPNGVGWSNRKSLKTLVIGRSLKHVNFSGNETLEYIKMRSSIPPKAVGFTNYNYINTILYVPKGAKAAYESADIWKTFWNIQEYDLEGEEVNVKRCSLPQINYLNGKLSFVCETENAICHASITDTDIKTYSGNEIELSVTYNISVYATKAGYENSDVATATLCWIDAEPQSEGIDNGISQVRANAILIQSFKGTLTISGAIDGTSISVYNTSGVMVGSAKAFSTQTSIVTGIRNSEIAIVKIGDKAVKVMMK